MGTCDVLELDPAMHSVHVPSTADPWRWTTYGDMRRRSLACLHALRQRVPGATAVAVAGPNVIDWFVVDLALLLGGITSVPIHADAPPDVIAHIAQYVDCCVVHPSLAARFDATITAKPCFVFGELDEPTADASAFTPPTVTGDAVATIVHTSGSTGLPKGAKFSNTTLLRLITTRLGMSHVEDPLVRVSKSSLAHLSDREAVLNTLVLGGRIGMLAHVDSALQHLAPLGPGAVTATPRWFDHLRTTFHNQLDEGASKETLIAQYRAMFGPRLRSIALGGAACPAATKHWLVMLFGRAVVSDGYACTEAGQLADDDGRIYAHVTWRLRPVPALGYDARTVPRRGELLVRTPDLIAGYTSAEATRDAFDADGYFITGDVVEIVRERDNGSNGVLRIIDRVGSYFKPSQGVFVAPAQLECVFSDSALVDQVLVLQASVDIPQHAVSVVVRPARADVTLSQLTDSLAACASKAALQAWQRPAVVHITHDVWTERNGLMTCSNKINRLPLTRMYRPAIDALWRQRIADCATSGRDDARGVVGAAARVLGVPVSHVAWDRTLPEQGADSLGVLMFTQLQSQYTYATAATSTVLELMAGPVSTGMHPEQLEHDAAVHVDIAAEAAPQSARIAKVLLTGASGFVGAGLLRHMLDVTDWEIVCLLHKTPVSVPAAQQRRVTSIWRLSDARDIDTIIHAAAHVNHVQPYSAHFAANVELTRQLLVFSRQGRIKRLVHVSSTCVLDPCGHIRTAQTACGNGYTASKWVAETFLSANASAHQTLVILRLGMVGWDQHGCNQHDWLTRLISGCIALHCAPDDAHATLDLLPRDFACALAITLLQGAGRGLQCWHLVNPEHRVLLLSLVRWACPDLEAVPLPTWLSRADAREMRALRLFSAGLPDDSGVVVEDATTREACPGATWPAIDPEYVQLLLPLL